MKKAVVWLLVLVMVLGSVMTAQATSVTEPDESQMNCMAIVVGKNASETGYVLVGHNEDDGGRAKVHHGYVEPARWPAGTVLPAEEGRAGIPQVDNTFGFFWTQVKAASGGFSNADGFLNENGVYLVSNSNASSKVDTSDPTRVTEGGIEYNLRRVVAERATSARDARDIIIDMVETWGYAPSGRAYTVADKNEAYMVQIVSGKHYVAVRVPDDMVAVMPNHYTVHSLNEFEDMVYSDGLVAYATEKGWYNPQTDGEFDFAKVFQAGGSYKAAGNTYRHKHAMSMLTGTEWTDDYYPFAVTPSGKVSIEDVQAILSTHYEGTADDPENLRVGPGKNPHDTTLRRICTGSTIESAVCEFNAEAELTTLWTSFGHPCELPFIPLHPLNSVVTEIDQMRDPAAALENHLNPEPELMVYEYTGWQEFRDFQYMMELVYEDNIEALTALNAQYTAEVKAANKLAVKEAGALFEEGNIEQARAIMTQFDQNVTSKALRQLKAFAAENFNTVTIAEGKAIDRENTAETHTVTFTMNGNVAPVESSILFGMGNLNTRTQYLAPIEGSLKNVGGNTWTVDFEAAKLASRAACDGQFDHFFGGLDENGKAFTGMTLLTFGEEVYDGTLVTAEVGGDYTLSIPQTIDFGALSKNSGVITKEFSIEAKNVILVQGTTLNVTIDTVDGSAFAMKTANGATLPFSVYTGSTALNAGDLFASFTTDGTANGTASVDTANITAAGAYNGQIIFNAEIAA